MLSSEISWINSFKPFSLVAPAQEFKISAWDFVRGIFSSIGDLFARIFCMKSLAERNVTVLSQDPALDRTYGEMLFRNKATKKSEIQTLDMLLCRKDFKNDQERKGFLRAVHDVIHGKTKELNSKQLKLVENAIIYVANNLLDFGTDDKVLERKISLAAEKIKSERSK